MKTTVTAWTLFAALAGCGAACLLIDQLSAQERPAARQAQPAQPARPAQAQPQRPAAEQPKAAQPQRTTSEKPPEKRPVDAEKTPPTSYAPVIERETFDAVVKRMSAEKAGIMQDQQAHLEERYDLSDKPAEGVKMTRGKAVQGGVRAKLPRGATWDKLAGMTAGDVKEQNPGRRASCHCRIPIIPKAACSFRSSTSTRSRSRKPAT